MEAQNRIYSVWTHHDASPWKIIANSPARAVEIAMELAAKNPPEFRSLVTELPGTEGGGYNYRPCRLLETPRAVRAKQQFGRMDN